MKTRLAIRKTRVTLKTRLLPPLTATATYNPLATRHNNNNNKNDPKEGHHVGHHHHGGHWRWDTHGATKGGVHAPPLAPPKPP